MGLRLLLTLFTLATALSPLAAQDTDYLRALKSYRRGIQASRQADRLAAIESFARCRHPSAIEALIEDARDACLRCEKLRTEATKLGHHIDRELKKRVYDRGEPGKYNPADLAQAEKKLAPDRRRLAQLEERVLELKELVEALETAVGDVVAGLPEASRSNAAVLVGRLLDRARKPEDRAGILQALGHADDALIRDLLIEEVLRADRPSLRVIALDALRIHSDPSSERAAVCALEDDAWQVRAAALPLLAKVGSRESIEPLIDALEREDGRLITDVVKTLEALTKRKFHDNVTLWREWWTKNAAAFEGRGRTAGVRGGDEVAGGGDAASRRQGNYFYGIETRSKKILYILDVSGSMQWRPEEHWWNGCGRPQPPTAPVGERKMDRSIKELLASIASLPKTGSFNVIFFNGEVSVWKKKMQKATKPRKAEARKWAQAIDPIGGTNISDALEKAFDIAGRGAFDRHYAAAIDTIFFLSDGDPSAGRTTDKAQILRDVQEWNRLARIQIHCVGLGPNESAPYIAFMANLARQNQGQFVLVAR